MTKQKFMTTAKEGLVTSNPVFRLVLGMCPTLAVTTTMFNGIGMGLATTFVLLFSNILVSLLRNIIPSKVRIPAYILIIATFVTMVEMLMYKFLPELNDSLGVFISLIVVNCIVLARAESFASKNPVLDSTVDALSMGIGFTLSITILGALRELLGSGALMGMQILPESFPVLSIFTIPSGGFLMLGMIMALFNYIYKRIEVKNANKKTEEVSENKEEEVNA